MATNIHLTMPFDYVASNCCLHCLRAWDMVDHNICAACMLIAALLLSTVPSAPENVTLAITPANTLSQLLVRWTIDPQSELISNYTVYVTRLDVGNTTLNYTSINTQLNIPSNDLDPSDLDAGEQVLVHVSASNSAGEGARSPGVMGRTREERKTSQQECDHSLCWVVLIIDS